MKIMIIVYLKGPAKFVPAAAVRRMGRMLFIVTGRKAPVGGPANQLKTFAEVDCDGIRNLLDLGLVEEGWSSRSRCEML